MSMWWWAPTNARAWDHSYPRTSLCTVQCTKNRPTCENYTANDRIFQVHQLNPGRFPVYPGAISNSRTFPGVADTLMHANKTTMTSICEKNWHSPFVSVLQACQWWSHKFLAAQTGASCDQNPRASSDRKVSSVHCTCSHKPPYQLVEMLKNMYFFASEILQYFCLLSGRYEKKVFKQVLGTIQSVQKCICLSIPWEISSSNTVIQNAI